MAELRFAGRDNPDLPIWLNPNIFLQSTPEDPTPFLPQVGEPVFLSCSVKNTGSLKVRGAEVKFYICEPATVPTPGISVLVGRSYVDLDVEETKEVLCLQTWKPRSAGHFCVIAEIHSSDDPSPFTSDTPWQIQDRHIAQHNLNIENLSGRSVKVNIRSFAAAAIANEPYSFLEARHARNEEFAAIFKPFGGLVRNNLTAKTRVSLLTEYVDQDQIREPEDTSAKALLKGLRENEQKIVNVALMLPDITFDQVYGSVVIVEQFDGKHNLLGGVAFGLLKGPPGTRMQFRRLERPVSAIAASIPYRPYSTFVENDFMTPDGIFCSNFKTQNINAQIQNDGPSVWTETSAYIESIEDPNIVLQYSLARPPGGSVRSGGSFKSQFRGDFSRAASQETLISVIVQQQSGAQSRNVRLIKKIFVVGIEYNRVTRTFRLNIPQGSFETVIKTVIAPKPIPVAKEKASSYPLFIKEASMIWRPVPAYPGPDGPLPFEDPLWKILLCLLAAALAIAGAIEAANAGGDASIGHEGQFAEPINSQSCCSGLEVEASTDSYVSAGLFAAAAAVATAAGLADGADLHIRGREKTVPPDPSSLTVAERADFVVELVEAPSPGTAFTGKIQWQYERTLDSGQTLTHNASDPYDNIHYLKERVLWIDSTVVRDPELRHSHPRGKPLIIEASFVQPSGRLWTGPDLYVFVLLWSDRKDKRTFELRDDGDANDNIEPKIGRYRLVVDTSKLPEARTWYVFVFAQDVNNVLEGTSPREAAKTVGGLLLTNQFVVGLDGKPCELNHDAIIELE